MRTFIFTDKNGLHHHIALAHIEAVTTAPRGSGMCLHLVSGRRVQVWGVDFDDRAQFFTAWGQREWVEPAVGGVAAVEEVLFLGGA
jgi:hypothetical protein